MKPPRSIVTILCVLTLGFVSALIWQRRISLRLRQEHDFLQGQAAQLAQAAADNQRLSLRLVEISSQAAPPPVPRLPAPPVALSDVPAEPLPEVAASTNLIALLVRGGKPPALSSNQIQAYLAANHASPDGLLAAFRATDDTNFLNQALENFSNNPQVNYAALFQASSPEERRQRLEAFKQAAPENALANYLSAYDHLKAGQNDLAVQELISASRKASFEDYSMQFVQSAEETWRAAGYSVADSKTLAATQLLLPDLKELRQLGRDTVALANTYRQAGDEASAQALLQINLGLGQRFKGSAGEPLISQLVGIAIENDTLEAMAPNAPYGPNGQTVQDRRNDLSAQRNSLKNLAKFESLLETMPPQDVISYWDRWRGFGTEATLRWVEAKYGQQ